MLTKFKALHRDYPIPRRSWLAFNDTVRHVSLDRATGFDSADEAFAECAWHLQHGSLPTGKVTILSVCCE